MAICSLCAHKGQSDLGVNALLHPNAFVDSKGKTCAALMVELFPLNPGDRSCFLNYTSHHARCCHVDGAPPILQDPPPAPPQYTLDGPFKRCDLCLDGSAPTAVGMVINMLYIGVGSCSQYYQYGQRGWIQDHLCKPLQFFAREPCGCPVSS